MDILSGDRDLLQALIMDVRVLMPEKGLTLVNTITPEDFLQKYCFRPVFFPDYKALMGDSSDNFLGVKGIGPVMAKKLITRYGDLKSIYLEIEALSPKIQQLLLNQKEQVFFFKKLAVLIDDIKFDYQFASLVLNKNAQNNFFKKYRF